MKTSVGEAETLPAMVKVCHEAGYKDSKEIIQQGRLAMEQTKIAGLRAHILETQDRLFWLSGLSFVSKLETIVGAV